MADDGKLTKTIEDRKGRAFGFSNQINAILKEVPLGKYKVQMGLHLRQAMLLNGILFNSEAWHCLTDNHIEQLQIIDNQLLRKICNAHSKTSTAFLHLETGTMPLKYVITSRRLNFLKEILSRKNSDLIYHIFAVQYENPLKGDFVKLIEDNFKLINEKFDMKFIKGMSKKKFKKSVKGKVRKSSL